MKALQSLRGLLFPRVRCLGCQEPRAIDPGQPLCAPCMRELRGLRLDGGVCPHCLSPRRADEPCAYCAHGGMRYLQAAYAPYRYHGVAQKLVVRLKYGGVYYAGDLLLEGMLDALGGAGFDALVPVPMAPSALRARGFNQAAFLAKGIAEATSGQVLDVLYEKRRARQQSSLPHDKREKNVEDLYGLKEGADVRGLALMLVDDVRTTGSTARSAAKTLLASGAKSVSLLTATVAASYSSPSASAASAR